MKKIFIFLCLVILCLPLFFCTTKKGDDGDNEKLWRECQACNGAGNMFTVCPDCNGEGRIGKHMTVTTDGDICRWCKGTGWEKCTTCSGQGSITRTTHTETAYEGDECGRCFGSGREGAGRCPKCNGSGMVGSVSVRSKCVTCNGKGKTQCSMCWGKGRDETYTYDDDYYEICDRCSGEGQTDQECSECKGRGFVPAENKQ